jgi:hypothetical protein
MGQGQGTRGASRPRNRKLLTIAKTFSQGAQGFGMPAGHMKILRVELDGGGFTVEVCGVWLTA